MFVNFGKPYCKVGDTCPLSFFNHNAAGSTVSMLQAAKKDYIVYRPVAKHAVSSSQLRTYVYKASRSCLLCNPYILRYNLIYLSPLIFNHNS